MGRENTGKTARQAGLQSLCIGGSQNIYKHVSWRPYSFVSLWTSLREASHLNKSFLGFIFPAGHTHPLRAHLKYSYPKRVTQEVRGENQHLSVASIEVNAGQLVQLGVHPVQTLAQQVLGRRDQVRHQLLQLHLCPTELFSTHIPRPHTELSLREQRHLASMRGQKED